MSTSQSEWNKRNRERINQRERERYYRDPEYREHIKAVKRKQYHDLSDEAKAERNAKCNAKQKDKYRNDPEYREECKRKALERYYRNKEAKKMYNEPLFFFDLETTGLDIDTCGIVQLAFKKYDKETEDGNRWETSDSIVMNPLQPIDPKASAVHGYYDEDVVDKPSFEVYADELFAMADGAIWVGYNNARFDIPIFKNAFKRIGHKIPKPAGVIDCYKIFTYYYGMSRKKGARTLMAAHINYCGEAFDGAHDAFADIEATYNVLAEQIDVHSDTLTLEKALSISSEVDMRIDHRGLFKFGGVEHTPMCAFGKYAGVPLDKIPSGYLKWVMGNETFGEDTRKVASNALIGVYPVWHTN